MHDKKVSILGCGWLGLPLAKSLIKQGYTVLGSTTSEDKISTLEAEGIKPFKVSLPDDVSALPELLDTDILVINFPPGTRRDPSGKAFLAAINELMKHLKGSSVKHIIYTSSTSVYLSENKIIKGIYVRKDSTLLDVEVMFRELDIPTTTLRLGGLLGPHRTLLKHFSGKEKTGGNLPVNYVYQDDVVRAIEAVINAPQEGTFNICADKHPSKAEFYYVHCNKKKIPLPTFVGEDLPWKIIDNHYFKEAFDFKYNYPDPLEFPL